MNQEPSKPRKFDGGAGVLVLARDTGRFLALKRSDHVQHGRTWALTGGLIDPGETPLQAAAREMREETNYNGAPVDLVKLSEYHNGSFTYTNYIAVIDHEFQPVIDHENEGYKWVDSLADFPDPKHFGIKSLLNDPDAMRLINEKHKEVKDALAASPPVLQSYPPTLFHAAAGMKKGEDIQPKNGVVNATENPREAIASLTPHEFQLAKRQLPGSEDVVVIIENRDEFMKKKFEGAIILLSGEGFTRQPAKDGTLTSKWQAANPVPVTQRNFFDKIRSMDDAMLYGVHFLFTSGPATPEQKAKIADAVKAPDFPGSLKKLVADGTLAYENAARDMHVSPLICPALEGDAVKNKQPFVRLKRVKP